MNAPEADLIERYKARNERFLMNCIYRLSGRGFYSEINNLLNAVAICLLTGVRIHIDTSGLGRGLDWDALFHFPNPAPYVPGREPEMAALLDVTAKEGSFYPIRKTAVDLNTKLFDFEVEPFGRFADFFAFKSALARTLLVRRFDTEAHVPGTSLFAAARADALARTPFDPDGPKVAFHIRRGDKTQGIETRKGLVIEGEDIEPKIYMRMVYRAKAPKDEIFVMTDDTSRLADFQAFAPATRFVTLSRSEQGYFQSEHNKLSSDEKNRDIRQLMLETQIAAAADLLVCPMKSNVGRFAALWGEPTQQLVSADRLKTWTPR